MPRRCRKGGGRPALLRRALPQLCADRTKPLAAAPPGDIGWRSQAAAEPLAKPSQMLRGREGSGEQGWEATPAPVWLCARSKRKRARLRLMKKPCLGKFPLYFLIYFCKLWCAPALLCVCESDAAGFGQQRGKEGSTAALQLPLRRARTGLGGPLPPPGALHTAWAPQEQSCS